MPSPNLPGFHIALLALLPTAAPAAAQNETLVLTGDSLPGLGVVEDVYEVAVNDAGDWLVTLRTDSMLPGQCAILHNGAVVLAPGDPIAGPQPGWTFTGARSVDLDASGRWTWTAGSATAATQYGTGVYLDQAPYAVIGEGIDAPSVTSGTTYTGFYDQQLANGDSMVVHAIMNDPAILGFQQNFLARLVTQTGGGFLPLMIVKRGDLLPGSTSPVQSISETRNALAANLSGQELFQITFQSGLEAVYLGQVPIALEGGQSPVFGRKWQSFTRTSVALNDHGDHAFGGWLTGELASNKILVWNGIELARTGVGLPAIAPFALTDLGIGKTIPSPLRLTLDGRILWWAAWDDPDTTRDSGLFLDHELLLQEGVSALAGQTIDDFATAFGYAPSFDISPDGDTLAIRALLADGRTGAFLVRPAGAVEPIAGCAPNLGSLTAFGPYTVGSAVGLTLDGAQSPGAQAFVFLSTGGIGPCGFALPGVGEVLIDFLPPNPFLVVPGLFPGLPTSLALLPQLPDDPRLFGLEFRAQGLWIDTTGAPGVPLFRLTNALDFAIGL